MQPTRVYALANFECPLDPKSQLMHSSKKVLLFFLWHHCQKYSTMPVIHTSKGFLVILPSCIFKKLKIDFYFLDFRYLLSLYWSAWFIHRYKSLAQKSVRNLTRPLDISAVISCSWRNLWHRWSHLQKFLSALVVTSVRRCLAPQSALGAGAKMTTQIASLDFWPKPCVLIAGITAVQWCITTEDWCRDVTSEQGRQFGSGLWLNFRWLLFMIPEKNLICSPDIFTRIIKAI